MDRRHRIPTGLVYTSVDEAFSDFRKLSKDYSKRNLSRQDMEEILHEAMKKHSIDEMKKCGITCKFTPESYLRFTDDFRRWAAGGNPNSTEGEPWLFDDNLNDVYDDLEWLAAVRSSSDYGSNPRTMRDQSEASVEDKIQFFRFMEGFRIPYEYFQPMPVTTLKPDKTLIKTEKGISSYAIGFNCINDNGLTQDPNPVGKSFVLTNDLGIKAYVHILEKRTPGENTQTDYDNQSPLGAFLAKGIIEGYTSEDDEFQTVVIRTYPNGTISQLCIKEYEGIPSDAFKKYSLWQDYFNWIKNHDLMKKKIRGVLFNQYLGPES
ncbi:MAG: hypothetical protein K6F84_08075 [Lachnospiraceae bacterium]|nr:hypothetical protein [Lachnospiraceae bacterium]